MRALRIEMLALLIFLLIISMGCGRGSKEPYDEAVRFGAQGKFEAAQKMLKNILGNNEPYNTTEEQLLELINDTLTRKIKKEATIYIFKGVGHFRGYMTIKYTTEEMRELIEGGPDVVTRGSILVDKAIEEYNKAIAINPNIAVAHHALGRAYKSKMMEDKAIEEYKKAISIDPDEATTHYLLGDLYSRKGMVDEAIEELEKVIALGIKPIFLRQAHKLLEDLKQHHR